MFNYFMLIGIVEKITKNSINIFCSGEHLELMISDSILDSINNIEIDQMIGIVGVIKEAGLFIDRIVYLENKKVDFEDESKSN